MYDEEQSEMIRRFFAFARERHAIYLRRQAGVSAPWTRDPVLSHYRFTNVFRELDATTVWFRENVRDPMRDDPRVLLATVLFRWFNRITTGETIFATDGPHTPWERALEQNSTDPLYHALKHQEPPYVTGAYIVKTPNGFDKLGGVLKCVEWFIARESTPPGYDNPVGWGQFAEACERGQDVSLEEAWGWLRQFPYMGDFMAYEVITDLRHTKLLERAPDIMTWANPGPGAHRGLSRIFCGWTKDRRPNPPPMSKMAMNKLMRDLLTASTMTRYWPQRSGGSLLFDHDYCEGEQWRLGDIEGCHQEAEHWPAWEMREVEHTLCEFDKYERARLGEGKPRGVYRHGT